MKKFIGVIAGVLMLFASCEKFSLRGKYTGEYEFTTYIHRSMMESEDSTIEFYDTIVYQGSIEKFEKERLEVVYFPDAKEPVYSQSYPVQLNGKMYPVVSASGSLSYPDLTEVYGVEIFYGLIDDGNFEVTYQVSFHAGSEEVRIEGYKK